MKYENATKANKIVDRITDLKRKRDALTCDGYVAFFSRGIKQGEFGSEIIHRSAGPGATKGLIDERITPIMQECWNKVRGQLDDMIQKLESELEKL